MRVSIRPLFRLLGLFFLFLLPFFFFSLPLVLIWRFRENCENIFWHPFHPHSSFNFHSILWLNLFSVIFSFKAMNRIKLVLYILWRLWSEKIWFGKRFACFKLGIGLLTFDGMFETDFDHRPWFGNIFKNHPSHDWILVPITKLIRAYSLLFNSHFSLTLISFFVFLSVLDNQLDDDHDHLRVLWWKDLLFNLIFYS